MPAFGRRVHIFNAIKELRRQVEPSGSAFLSQTQGFGMHNGSISPTMSGYMPDTPSSQANFSPMDTFSPQVSRLSASGNFGPAASMAMPAEVDEPARRSTPPARSDADADALRGLGFSEEANKSTASGVRAATVVSGHSCCAKPSDFFDRVIPLLDRKPAGHPRLPTVTSVVILMARSIHIIRFLKANWQTFEKKPRS